MSSHVDFVIIGHGLAGTALAWALLRRGRSVLVIDRERGGCSRLAAGLITPITGKRLAKSWRWGELYPAAVAFYRSLEADTGTTFFHERPALRLFATEAERVRSEQRSGIAQAPDIRADWFDAPLGGFEMDAARLDVQRYLDTSREHFESRGAYLAADVGWHSSRGTGLQTGGGFTGLETGATNPNTVAPIELTADGVRLPSLSVEARALILCRGFDATADPWFGSIAFKAAKGEILTVRIPGLAEERVVHRGIWLAPAGAEVFRAGSTYAWEPLDALPTADGRAEIEARLRAFLRLPFQVIDHQAAVRPVIDAGFPALGRHPRFPQLAYFNGLGSKGSLLAPFFADQLATHLCDGGEIEPQVNVLRFL